jgi:hypothetical protein
MGLDTWMPRIVARKSCCTHHGISLGSIDAGSDLQPQALVEVSNCVVKLFLAVQCRCTLE